jgi:hypothetical protein
MDTNPGARLFYVCGHDPEYRSGFHSVFVLDADHVPNPDDLIPGVAGIGHGIHHRTNAGAYFQEEGHILNKGKGFASSLVFC